VYDHKFKKDGHKLQLEVNYNDFDEDENSSFSFTGNTGAFSSYVDHLKRKTTGSNFKPGLYPAPGRDREA
jgi:hypothetical protein